MRWTRPVEFNKSVSEVTCAFEAIIPRNGDGWPGFCGGECGHCFPLESRLYKRGIPTSHTQPHVGDIVDMSAATSDDTAPEGYTTVHGFYRFTDIFYEWCVRSPRNHGLPSSWPNKPLDILGVVLCLSAIFRRSAV